MDIIFQTLLSLGLTGGAFWVLFKWFGDRIGENLFLKTKSKYDKELEELRNTLSNKHGLLDSTVTTISAGFATSQERRLDAIQKLWDNILSIRDFVSSFVFFYDILLPSEYENALSSYREKIIPEITQEEFSHDSTQIINDIEKLRPFLGERLWVYFFHYRAFSMRIGLKFIQGRDKNQIYSWDKRSENRPDYVVNLIRQILTNDEVEKILKLEIGAPRMAMNLMEQKILIEINHIISGSSAAQFSLSEGLKLAETLRKAESMMSNEKIN